MWARGRPHRHHKAPRAVRCGKGEKDVRVADVIDLSPLLRESEAAEMLLRARGQLNRAFRKHGLFSPDPLPLSDIVHVEAPESDDPAADGIATARARYKGAFDVWASQMPLTLAQPVLEILRQTHEALSVQHGDSATAQTAVMRAYDFLASRVRPGESGAERL